MNTKINKTIANGGKKVYSFEGIDLYLTEKKSKTGKGKDRVWFTLKQDEGYKKWEQKACLAFGSSVDVQFVKDRCGHNNCDDDAKCIVCGKQV